MFGIRVVTKGLNRNRRSAEESTSNEILLDADTHDYKGLV